ncbi:MAG: YfiR family protein [Burkholderiaceae bacterium]|nr:YfiR family protein [Burkholderiaceae bacterium]
MPALAQTAQEHAVKAAFLFRFLSFIEWPQPSSGPIVVGFVGAEAVAGELERVVPGRNVEGRDVSVRRLLPGESPNGVHLVMVGREQSDRIAALARQGVLVVGESGSALDRGAAINFLIADGRVRFEVSLPAAERAKVRIGARMLAVAQHVRGTMP